MKRHYTIEIKGATKLWSIDVYAKKEHADEWFLDGLDVFEVYNTVPYWVNQVSLTKVWCFIQDLLSFRNPFK